MVAMAKSKQKTRIYASQSASNLSGVRIVPAQAALPETEGKKSGKTGKDQAQTGETPGSEALVNRLIDFIKTM